MGKVYESGLFSETDGKYDHRKVVAVYPPIAEELARKALRNQVLLEPLGPVRVVDGGNSEITSAFLLSDVGHYHGAEDISGAERVEAVVANLCILSNMGEPGDTPQPRYHKPLDAAVPVIVPGAEVVTAQPA